MHCKDPGVYVARISFIVNTFSGNSNKTLRILYEGSRISLKSLPASSNILSFIRCTSTGTLFLRLDYIHMDFFNTLL